MGASLSSSMGCLSCLVICPPCCCCCLVGASSSIPHVVVISHPPHHHCHCPWAICPVEALSLLLSSRGLVHSPGRCRQPSPTLLLLLLLLSAGHSSCRGLIHVVIWWGPCRHWESLSVPTSSLSSSAGHFSCRGLILVVVWWGSCCPSLTLSSSLSSACLVGASSLPHIVVVICGPLVLQRPCPSPTLSSSLSSLGHLSCGGLVAIVVQWGPPPPC